MGHEPGKQSHKQKSVKCGQKMKIEAVHIQNNKQNRKPKAKVKNEKAKRTTVIFLYVAS